MDETKKCVIHFDPTLTSEELGRRIDAIRLIQGVVQVETPITHHRIVPKPMPESQRTRPIPLASEQADPSRAAIDLALRFGLENQWVTPKELSQLAPEQVIQLAIGFLDRMPEDLKAKLGGNFTK